MKKNLLLFFLQFYLLVNELPGKFPNQDFLYGLKQIRALN